MPDPDDYQRKVAAALMETILDQSMTDIDGEPTAYIRSIEAAGALVTCLATILEGAPNCRTPKGMREMAEDVGKGLHKLMREMRQLRVEGNSPFQADVIYTN